MSALPGELRDLIESGPMAHLSTINADGSPQVTVIWIGLDGDDLVSGHMSWHVKLQNMERDPRVVLSFDGPRVAGAFLNEYAALRARAAIEPGDAAWHLLNRLAKVDVALTPSSRRRRVPAISCVTPSSASAASAPGGRSLRELLEFNSHFPVLFLASPRRMHGPWRFRPTAVTRVAARGRRRRSG